MSKGKKKILFAVILIVLVILIFFIARAITHKAYNTKAVLYEAKKEMTSTDDKYESPKGDNFNRDTKLYKISEEHPLNEVASDRVSDIFVNSNLKVKIKDVKKTSADNVTVYFKLDGKDAEARCNTIDGAPYEFLIKKSTTKDEDAFLGSIGNGSKNVNDDGSVLWEYK